jgi:alpha-soluble NSF attachment protein
MCSVAVIVGLLAMQHYQLAADYFRGEESNSAANKCLVKVAQYAAQLENFEKGMSTRKL